MYTIIVSMTFAVLFQFAGSCKLVCIEFVPLHDKQQCLWAAQWVLASQGAGLLSHVCKTFSCRSDTNAISIIDHPIPDHSGTASAIYRYFTSKTSKDLMYCIVSNYGLDIYLFVYFKQLFIPLLNETSMYMHDHIYKSTSYLSIVLSLMSSSACYTDSRL